MTYDGSQVPLSIERLAMKYPGVDGKYLLSLLQYFLQHYKSTGNLDMPRSNALRHGDESLLTMLSAFVPGKKHEKSNYLTMSHKDLVNLSIHRKIIAREMGVKVLENTFNQSFLSKFYKERVTIHGHRNAVFCLAFDKTNRRLFTGSDDYLVKVWCVRTGYLIHTIRGHQNVITDIAINEENTLIATASADGYIRVWKMDGYKQVVSLKLVTAGIKPFTTVRFSPSPRSETRFLMATNEDGIVRLWKWNRDTLQFSDRESPIAYSCKFKGADKLKCSSFNYTGSKFTVAGDDGFVYVFSTIKNTTNDTGKSSKNESKASKKDGRGKRKVASALYPDLNTDLLPQLAPVSPIAILEGHMGSITDLTFSHDGQRILSGSQDGTARIWSYNKNNASWSSIILDINKMENVPIVKPLNEDELKQETKRRLSYSNIHINNSTEIGTCIPPFSPTLASCQISSIQNDVTNSSSSRDELTQQTNTNNEQQQENEEPPKVSMIAWSADDRLCIIATTHGDIKVYNTYSGELTCVLKGHQGEIYAVDSHPQDPSTILSAGYDGNIILWDINRQTVISWHNHQGRIFLDCKFSKDGMKYAITDGVGKCTLFSINGLDKDYAQARTWTRGQQFYNDYLPVQNSSDGIPVDLHTNLPTHALPPTSITDLQGVEYSHQPRRGYGKEISIHNPTFELEDAQRAICYDKEEMDISLEPPIPLPTVDRVQSKKRREEFVHNDDDDDNDGQNTNEFIFPPPIPVALLDAVNRDDENDEDYNEEMNTGQNYGSSEEDSEDGRETGSDVSMNDDEAIASQWDESDDRSRITRSRASRTRHSQSPEYSGTSSTNRRSTQPRRKPSSSTSTRGGRGRGRPPLSTIGRSNGSQASHNRNNTRSTRGSHKRRRGLDIASDDDDERVKPRLRARNVQTNYAENDSDFEISEDDLISITDHNDDVSSHQDDEAGPSTSTRQRNTRARSINNYSEKKNDNNNNNNNNDDDDDSGKYNNYKENNDDDDDDDYNAPVNKKYTGKRRISDSSDEDEKNEMSIHSQRTTRSQQHQSSTSSSSTMNTSTTTNKGKGKIRNTNNNKPQRKPHHRSTTTRDLTDEEMEAYLPLSWISITKRSVEKYLPQMGDYVAILSEGYQQYWENSELKDYFNEKFAPTEIHLEEPVTFATIVGISWLVGPPTYCRLKLQIKHLTNLNDVLHKKKSPIWSSTSSPSRGRGNSSHRDEITIEFSDEDGCPEFLILLERFLASMSLFFGSPEGRQRVDAMYDDGKYTGQVSATNNSGVYWNQANSQSPWACYHIIWDDESSPPEDLSPWEIVPTGEDFNSWYDVGPSLTSQQIRRANDVLDWISNTEDFLLYVNQVDYYTYRNYLSKIPYPICLNMVKERLNNGFYHRIEALIDDVELIRKNAQKYNHETSLANKNAVRMANFFKTRMLDFRKPLSVAKAGGRSKVIKEESDDEYDDAVINEESEDSAPENKKDKYSDEESDDDEFIDDDDDD
ncbi:unnamed protein product [Cunninghamella blakesleeana]